MPSNISGLSAGPVTQLEAFFDVSLSKPLNKHRMTGDSRHNYASVTSTQCNAIMAVIGLMTVIEMIIVMAKSTIKISNKDM